MLLLLLLLIRLWVCLPPMVHRNHFRHASLACIAYTTLSTYNTHLTPHSPFPSFTCLALCTLKTHFSSQATRRLCIGRTRRLSVLPTVPLLLFSLLLLLIISRRPFTNFKLSTEHGSATIAYDAARFQYKIPRRHFLISIILE